MDTDEKKQKTMKAVQEMLDPNDLNNYSPEDVEAAFNEDLVCLNGK